jgi:hypothetical protein
LEDEEDGTVVRNKEISERHADPEKLRLPSNLHHGNEDEINDFFLIQCDLVELMMSFTEKGYV